MEKVKDLLEAVVPDGCGIWCCHRCGYEGEVNSGIIQNKKHGNRHIKQGLYGEHKVENKQKEET